MSDSLSRYLSQLHSLLSSDALQRGVEANNTAVDLSSFCLENVSDREQGKVRPRPVHKYISLSFVCKLICSFLFENADFF